MIIFKERYPDIERAADKLRVTIHTSRPGIIIGRKGAEVDKLRDDLMRRYGQDIHSNIQAIQRPEIDAHLIAAAPDLLEALKDARERGEKDYGPEGEDLLVITLDETPAPHS